MRSRSSSTGAIAFVAVAWLAFRLLGQDLSAAAEGALKIALWVIPSLLIVRANGGGTWRGAARALGLGGSVAGGALFGIVCTLPVAVMVTVKIASVIDLWYGGTFQIARLIRGWNLVVGNAILGPFAEEVLFRGFLIYMLVRVAHWRALPVIVVSGAMFGLAHVGNGTGLLQVPGIAFGGVVFAWIAIRRGTIWPAIGLHAWLNLWWDFFPPQAQVGNLPSLLAAALLTIALGLGKRSRTPREDDSRLEAASEPRAFEPQS